MEFVTIVGGAILAPLFQSSLNSLKSSDLFTYARGSKVLEEVSKWKPTLETIFAVLDDAEELQMTDGVVKSWFNDLRDLAYDVDDILDELITHAGRRKLRAESETSSSKVGKLLRGGLILSKSVKFSAGMVSKVKDVSQRLEDMKKRMDLPKIVGGRNIHLNEEIIARPLPTASLIEPKVCGREEDHKAILDMMKTEAADGGISVICIVGMGGIGKTTLAQMVYNDESIQVDFKAWVSIGEDFDLVKVTKTIVQYTEDDLDFLQSKLREKLSGKNFMVVLDDLWSNDYGKWTRFYRPFASGALASRIIITTRSNEVSLVTSAREGYLLQSLSYDDSLSLFAHHAFGKEDFIDHMDLMEVGREIVERCDGLPLALKALGGLLRGKPVYNVWKNLLQNKVWEERSKILPALRLSYYNLPPHLKRSFAYCSIFPKKYEFVRDELVLLWLAEGFVQDLSEAYDCFDELSARSLFQKSAKDESIFLMHDLITDLARSVSGRVCLNLDEEQSSRESYVEVRHSAFNSGYNDVASKFENFQHMKQLRTFLALPILEELKDKYISCTVLQDWIPVLKYLRVLSLSGYKTFSLPESIYLLQHLRYLNLCNAEIVTLPKSTSKLFNLQVLILCNCKKLRKLPRDFCNLINLQCLDLRGADSLEEMPLHIGNLSKLHILTKFIVGSTDGLRIKELLKIPNLQGQVHVKDLQNVVNMDFSDRWRMTEKEKIDGLVLEWNNNFDVCRNEENEKQVFEALQPQKNIARMIVNSYGGAEFPSWFGKDSFNLTFLEIYNCRNVSSLPPLGGLPSLKELSLEGMPGIKEVGHSNVFPSLEILNFKDLENWKEWCCFNNVDNEGQVFPKLRKLGIRCCPKLVGDFPNSFHSLEELVIEGCREEVLKQMSNLNSLTKLRISEISGLVSFDRALPKTLKSLQELEVEKCDELEHLWESGTEIERFGCLKDLKILHCSKLVSLVEGEGGVCPANLQLLKISFCDNLERLPNQLHSLKSLITLWIDKCPKLTTFGVFPDNEVFPTSLRVLIINEVLETQLLGSLQLQNHFSHLIGLYLLQGSMESFPATGLPILTLQILVLRWCGNLRSLPCNLHNLTSLQTLHLYNCPKIECFPERGMPPNLSRLEIRYCDTLERQPLSEWRLNQLSRLRDLLISGAMEMVSSFPHDSLPLPSSLTSLIISNFQTLKSISSGLQRLTSLRVLYIGICPKLKSLPKEGLPPSLGRLIILDCPLLEKQCKTGQGKYWSADHSHIPRIRYIYDSTELPQLWKDRLEFLAFTVASSIMPLEVKYGTALLGGYDPWRETVRRSIKANPLKSTVGGNI